MELVEDIERDAHFGRENLPAYQGRSFMSVAIKFNERLIGVLNVADKNMGEHPFTQLDLKVLSAIVTQSAVAIENANLSRELDYLCVTDPLTRLANYRFFINCVEHEIHRFKRFGQPLSLLVIDVDDFKNYNTNYGRMEGDLLLRELGKLLTGHLRAIDHVCRYGGDEFVILCPGTDLDGAKFAAEKLRTLVAQATFHSPITISIGVCEYKEPGSRFDFILKGDRALYHAKMSGKNQVFVCGQKEREKPNPS